MRIAFYFMTTEDNEFRKAYFGGWNDREPILTNKNKAKEYWCKELATHDLKKLAKMTSPIARTLNIRLEEER